MLQITSEIVELLVKEITSSILHIMKFLQCFKWKVNSKNTAGLGFPLHLMYNQVFF